MLLALLLAQLAPPSFQKFDRKALTSLMGLIGTSINPVG